MTLFAGKPGYFVVKIRYRFLTLFVLMTKLLANNTFRIRICHSVYTNAFTSGQINCATYNNSKQFTHKYRLLYRSIIGLLNVAFQVVAPIRAFIRRLIDATKRNKTG